MKLRPSLSFLRHEGVFVHAHSARFRDARGELVPVTFEIVDRGFAAADARLAPRYDVTISVGSDTRAPLFRASYDRPGVHTARVALGAPRRGATLVVGMTDERGLYFEDAFSLAYNARCLGALRWIAALPLLAAAPLVLLWSPSRAWSPDGDDGDARGGGGGGGGGGAFAMPR